MKRFSFARIFAIVQLLPVCCLHAADKNNNHKRGDGVKPPNVIFILTDDQRWSALGYAGNKYIKTPEMDKLARQGVYFSHAIATTPICAASRASIITGLYERTHRYTFQTGPIRKEFMEEAYPRLLKKAGYYTGFYGKFGVKFPAKDEMFHEIEDYDRNAAFDDYRGYYYKKLGNDTVHLTRYTGQKALDFIDKAPRDKPFCLSLSFSAPHAHDNAPLQYFWQKESEHLYQNEDLPKADVADDKYFQSLPPFVREGFNRLRWGWRFDTPEKYQHSVKGYYRMIYEIDMEIAKIRKKLEEAGLDKNTVIIFMGDNGYFLGERQIAGKWLMYDNSVRVPLIVYDPRVKQHHDNHGMALNIDVPATILDLAGIKIPDSYHGKSLMPVVSNAKSSLNRDTVLIEHLWEFESIPPSEGIRTAKWKYLRYINDKTFEELYDLTTDPKEINNLAGLPKYKKIVETFRAKNDELAKQYGDPYVGMPTGLMVEFIRNPQGVKIVDNKPEFSWMIPKGATFQKGYQILVASSKDLIDKNIGDVWNSGNVRSTRSSNVEFGGSPLKPNTSYFWKIRFFDGDNRISEYSGVQTFTTGEFGGKLTSHNTFQIEKIKPIAVKENPDGTFFADFGKDAFATLIINYPAKKKETLLVRVGEKLSDGRIDRNPGGTIRFQEVTLEVGPGKKEYQISLVPDARNTKSIAVALPDSFPVLIPFRYAEIQGAAGLKAGDLTQKAYFYNFDENASAFSSSSDVLNKVWELCKYTQKATSFSGYYVDGDRERIPYEADAYLNQLSHYSVDNEYTIARKTIEWFMQFPTWPTEWQLHMALLFYQDYMYTGNSELIEKYYEQLKHKSLMKLAEDNGLITTQSPKHNGVLMQELGFADTAKRLRDIVDWPVKGAFKGAMGEADDYEFKAFNTVINAFYYKNMEILAQFATLLNKPEEALDFQLRAAKAKLAINTLMWNEEKGYYIDGIGSSHGALHASMMPLAFGIVPESRVQRVKAHIQSRGMVCSVYGAQFLLEALYNANGGDYALALMTAKNDRSWWNMIRSGSTITWEAWDLIYKPNQDWNHAWGAAPANIIPRGLWGIKPKVAGYDVITIKPQMAGLKSSSIVVPTIKGQIKGSYTKKNDLLTEFVIELPANMVGEFVIDKTTEGEVVLNEETVNPLFSSAQLKSGINTIQIKINTF